MTDAQFGVLAAVLTAGLGGIAAAIRFGVGRLVAALDLNSKAMLENTASNAVLATKIDAVTDYVHRERGPTPVEGVPIVPSPAGLYFQHARKKSEPGPR